MCRFVVGFAIAFGAVVTSAALGQEIVYYPTTTYYAPVTYFSPVVTDAYYAPAPTPGYYSAPTTVYYGSTPIVMNVMNAYRPLVGNITRVRYAPVAVSYPTPTTVYYRW